MPSSKKLAEQNLEHLAVHDHLTGLGNREYFEGQISKALQLSASDDAEYALMSLDLDQFKIINDTCGHVAGDDLLKQVSLVLLRQTKDKDT
ncbi:GGDEF domain-containing protein, partial [Oleiphilus sp. HI0123]